MRKSLAGLMLVLLAVPALGPAGSARPPTSRPTWRSWPATELKGREAGTPEFDMAADYVAGQMKQIGLKPAAAKMGGYFQHVPLVAYRPQ